jgi:dihydroxy-acid dehydratase
LAQQTKLKSAKSFVGLENADMRNVVKAMGYSDDDLTTQRPVIGIANSWNTFIPGHYTLNQISEQVKKGIHRAGGTVFEFGLIGLCAAVQGSDLRFGGDYGRSQSHRWDCAIGILR